MSIITGCIGRISISFANTICSEREVVSPPFFLSLLHEEAGDRGRQWLRYCATNRKVAGSIPADVTGIFH